MGLNFVEHDRVRLVKKIDELEAGAVGTIISIHDRVHPPGGIVKLPAGWYTVEFQPEHILLINGKDLVSMENQMFWKDNLDKLWRFPDKMQECRVEKLLSFEKKGGYVAQQKLDGYRAVVFGDAGQVGCVSRHKMSMAVSQRILDRFHEIMGGSEPWMLDCEWVKLRTGTPEQLYILDTLYVKGTWVGSQPLDERQSYFSRMQYPADICTPKEVSSNFLEFLAAQIEPNRVKESLCEGVVIKKVKAPLIGSRTSSLENPSWAKCKWRAGEAGDTVILTAEQVLAIAR